MSKELIVSATNLESRLAILEDDQVTEIFIERDQSRSILGNIYKGRVTRVLPGMQAAFVDIGLERNAFLYVSDFFEDYEEYEEIFDSAAAVVEPAEVVAEKLDPRKGRRPGRRSRKPIPRAPEAEGLAEEVSAPVEAPSPVPVEEVEVKALPVPEGTGAVLPDRLPVDPALLKAHSKGYPDEGAGDEFPAILPTFFPVAAGSRRRRPRRGGRSGGRKVQVDEGSGLQHFAAPRGGRGRERRSDQSGVRLIGDLLKEGQEILVQVAKEPIAKKGARITSHIVFPGRYLVFMPTVDHVGVSRRIESSKERQRLRDLVQDLRGEVGRSFIVRTAGEGATREQLKQDMIYLTRLWEQIRSKAERASAPSLIHSELDLVQRVIRDFFSEEYRAIRVDDEQCYERIVEFITNFNPGLVKKVRLYTKNTPIFDEFGVSAEIEKSLKSKVWLKNGGYIVINQTEALVAIDVNTGKYVGKTNSLEDTIARTNLGAVREVARQIRLRDLGGIIVVDFIDMNDPKNQHRVYEALLQELRKDKSPSKILPFNEFGLVAITRKRVKQSLERTLCQPCSECEGTGMTKSVRTVCYSIHSDVRKTLPVMKEGPELIIRCHPDVGRALRESERIVTKEIEEMTHKVITVHTDPLMHIEQFDLVET